MVVFSYDNFGWRNVLIVFYSFFLKIVRGQTTTITVQVNVTTGLVYFLVVFFFSFNFGTPIIRYIYYTYLVSIFERAGAELKKVSKRLSDRMSDAGRKVSQTIRSTWVCCAICFILFSLSVKSVITRSTVECFTNNGRNILINIVIIDLTAILFSF